LPIACPRLPIACRSLQPLSDRLAIVQAIAKPILTTACQLLTLADRLPVFKTVIALPPSLKAGGKTW